MSNGIQSWGGVAVVVLAVVSCRSRSERAAEAATNSTKSPTVQVAPVAAAPLAAGDDPALLRRDLLRQIDARIDAASAQAHLEARWIMDQVIPIPYLGIDSEPATGGMHIKAVYAMTGAEAAGMKKGDLLVALDGRKTESKRDLAQAIRLRKVGDTLDAQIVRDGREQHLACTLRARPEEDEDEEEQFPDLPPRAPPSSTPSAFDFEHDELGTAPKGWSGALGGHGRMGRWIVTTSGGGRVLRQDDDDPTGIRFPIALVDGFDGKNVVARVRFRYAGGKVDKAGGIVLHYVDPGNYLVARANAAEGDLRIFRVLNGLRTTLPDGIGKGATDDDAWHTLEFRAEGAKLTAILDGTVTVIAYDTCFLRGGVGLWTKSDSLTEFDDFRVEPLP